MADAFSSSHYADTEDCSSDSSLSLSVGYYPAEDTFSCENTISREGAPSKGPSVHFVPPFQGSWLTKSTGRFRGRQDQIQRDPEKFCKLSIMMAWDIDTGCNHSDSVITSSQGPCGGDQWTDTRSKEKPQLTLSNLNGLVQKLEQFLKEQKDDKDDELVFCGPARKEDFQLSGSTPPDVAHLRHQGQTYQDTPMFNPPKNEGAIQFPQIPPRSQEHELASEAIGKATGIQRTSMTETPSASSGKLEEDTQSSTQSHCCLSFRWVFRWLRQQVLSSFRGRKHPEKTTKCPRRLTQKKRLSHRRKRIQPQERIELQQQKNPTSGTN